MISLAYYHWYGYDYPVKIQLDCSLCRPSRCCFEHDNADTDLCAIKYRWEDV